MAAEKVFMTSEKVRALLEQFQKDIPENKVLVLRRMLENSSDDCFESVSTLKLKNPTTTLLLSIFLGWLGVDRFYIGDIGVGVCKLLFGWLTLLIWPFVDIFCSYKKAKEHNFNKLTTAIF